MSLTLRERRPEDLPVLWHWMHAEPAPEWRCWDVPYFHSATAPESTPLEAFLEQAQTALPSPHLHIVVLNNKCIGQTTRWEEAPAGGGWWELGLLIFDPRHWGGLGTQALRQWTDLTFRDTDAHVLTLTTWSGNERMIRAAQRAGWHECSRIPQARVWQGQRHDSVKMAQQRQEWENRS